MKEKYVPLWDDEKKVSFKTIHGIIHNCLQLNVRYRPEADSSVVAVLPAFTPVIVDLAESTDTLYKIRHYTTNFNVIEGYCRKEFVDMSPAEG